MPATPAAASEARIRCRRFDEPRSKFFHQLVTFISHPFDVRNETRYPEPKREPPKITGTEKTVTHPTPISPPGPQTATIFRAELLFFRNLAEIRACLEATLAGPHGVDYVKK